MSDRVTSEEAENPEYIYRPSIYFHARNDEDAKTRAGRLRHLIENAIEEDTIVSLFAYEQAWNDADSLQERLHLAQSDGSPTRIVS